MSCAVTLTAARLRLFISFTRKFSVWFHVTDEAGYQSRSVSLLDFLKNTEQTVKGYQFVPKF